MYNKTPVVLTLNHLASQVEKSSNVFASLSKRHKHMLQMANIITPVFLECDITSIGVADYVIKNDKKTLVLTAPSQSAANHYNYISDVFIDKLKVFDLFSELQAIEFIFVPNSTPNSKKTHLLSEKSASPKKHQRVSGHGVPTNKTREQIEAPNAEFDEQARAILTQASQATMDNKNLSEALSKLAAHIKNHRGQKK